MIYNEYVESLVLFFDLPTFHIVHAADTGDNCPWIYNRIQWDTDMDGVGDVCDNCCFRANFKQYDKDRDGIGNACDKSIRVANPGESEKVLVDERCKKTTSNVMYYDDDDRFGIGDKEDLSVEIMKKLLELYYGNWPVKESQQWHANLLTIASYLLELWLYEVYCGH